MQRPNKHTKDLHLSSSDLQDIQQNLAYKLVDKHIHVIRNAGLLSIGAAFVPLWSFRDSLDTLFLFSWFGAMIITNLASVVLFLFYKQNKPTASQIKPWNLAIRANILFSGLAWGSMGVLLVAGNLEHQIFILVFLIVVTSCFAFGTITDYVASVLGIVGSLSPFIFWQFYEGIYKNVEGLHTQTGIILIIYMIFLLSASLIGSRLVKESSELGFTNAALNDKLTDANQVLEERVKIRTKELQSRSEELASTLEIVTYQAMHDSRTDLANHLSFTKYLKDIINSNSLPSPNVAIFYLGLDNFKDINDSLTHAIGDSILKMIAIRFTTELPKVINSNINENNYLIARMMGDNFAIAVKNVPQEKDALYELAKQIWSIMTKEFILDNSIENLPLDQENHKDFRITISMGVAAYPVHGLDENTLLMNAETAMFHAKAGGRNKFLIYESSMNADTLENLRLFNDLRQAIGKNELVLHYQPVVELQKGQIIGVEALIRWQHPLKGLLNPAAFIPLAEDDHELMTEIDIWVIRTAAKQAKIWQQDMGLPPIKIAVNLSFTQINRNKDATKNIVNVIEQALKQNNIDPQYFEIELVESVACKHVNEAIAFMLELKKLGVKLAIDDFGTGFSALSYLEKFPLDLIKIDRSFIVNMMTSNESLRIVESIISMGRNLKLKILAEGVETIEQLKLTLELGCDYLQGYYFSRPIEPEKISVLLKNKNSLSLPIL